MYTIKLDQFEGPLDLLLELIESQKLEITKISLAQVTDQFLEFLKKNEDKITSANLANFVLVAAKLILIKSKALLPFLELTQEEEEDILDLEKQLKEYQRFRGAAELLKKLSRGGKLSFSRQYQEQVVDIFYPPANVSSSMLADIFKRVIADIPVIPELPKNILKKKISVEERIKKITELILERIEVSFHSLLKPHQGREHVVVNFLAMLELTKQKLVMVRQEEIFGEIKLIKL